MAPQFPPLGVALGVFGTSATVSPVGGAPIATTVIYHRQSPPPAVGALGLTVAPVGLRDAFAVPRATVPSLPVGSTILASRDGVEAARLWRVDRVDDSTPDETRVIVSPAPEP